MRRLFGFGVLTTLSGLLLAVTFGVQPALALNPDRALTQYVHTSWMKPDGLPVNAVLDIEQTRDGYLWLTTNDGLVRFDGVQLTWYHSGNTPGLDNNVLEALFEDSRGELWIGGNSGLFRWVDGSLEEVRLADGSSLAGANLIVEDDTGLLWVSFHGGIARVDDQIAQLYVLPDGSKSTRVTGLVFASDSSLWLAGPELIRIEGELVHRLGAEEGLVDLPMTVYEDLERRIWVGLREGGLARWDGETLTSIDGMAGLTVREIQADGADLWVASLGRGLIRYRADGTIEFLGSREGMISDDVFSLLQDREGNLWFGTQSGGLNRLRDGIFATLSTREGIPHRNVAAVFEDTRGTLWIGTSGGGLLSRTGEGPWRRWGRDHGLGSEAIMTITEDLDGRIWVGTGNAGAYWLDRERFHRVQRDGVDPVPVIFSLVAAPSGGVWIGGTGGAVWSDGKQVKRVTAVPGERPWMTTHILADRQDSIWIGARRSGLMRVEKGTPELFTPAEGLANDGALSLHLDSAGDLWIGTYGGGLQRRRAGRFETVRARDGLCEDVIYSILEDETGVFWLGGNRGVCRVDRDQIEGLFSGDRDRVESRLFGAADGLSAGETSGGPNRSAFRDSVGRLWFATPDGAAWVDPANLPAPRPAPQTLIEAMICDGQRVDLGDHDQPAQLPAETHGCSIDYTATALTRPSKITFRYRLKGEGNPWTDAGASRSVSLAGLAPGGYQFQVAAVGAAGDTGPISELRFDIAPHFYQTVWFRLLVLLTLATAALGIYRLRIHNLLRRQKWLESEVEARTEELAENNRTLEQRVERGIEKLRRAERFAAYGEMVASVAHEVRQPLFAMQAAGYVLSQKLETDSDLAPQLKTLDLETKRIGSLMEDLLDYARPAELDRAMVDVRSMVEEAVEIFRAEHGDGTPSPVVDIADGVETVWVDRARIVQVLVNLLGNARRHAGEAADIQISVRSDSESEASDGAGTIAVAVRDNGPGFAPEKIESIFEPFETSGGGSGLGLAIVRRIVEQHGGSAEASNLDALDSATGGAEITITLPAEPPPAEHS